MVADVLPHYEALESWIATERKRIPMPRGARKLELLLLAATEAIFDAYFGFVNLLQREGMKPARPRAINHAWVSLQEDYVPGLPNLL